MTIYDMPPSGCCRHLPLQPPKYTAQATAWYFWQKRHPGTRAVIGVQNVRFSKQVRDRLGMPPMAHYAICPCPLLL